MWRSQIVRSIEIISAHKLIAIQCHEAQQAYVESMPKCHQRFKVQENIALANRMKKKKNKHSAFNPILANENWGFKLK